VLNQLHFTGRYTTTRKPIRFVVQAPGSTVRIVHKPSFVRIFKSAHWSGPSFTKTLSKLLLALKRVIIAKTAPFLSFQPFYKPKNFSKQLRDTETQPRLFSLTPCPETPLLICVQICTFRPELEVAGDY